MSIIYDSNNVTPTANSMQIGDAGADWVFQTFTPTISYTAGSVALKMYKSATGTLGNVTLSIRLCTAGHQPTGSDLCVGTTPGDTLTTDNTQWTGGEWREITFSTSYALTSGTEYAIVARALTADAGKQIIIFGTTSNVYSGYGGYSTNGPTTLTWVDFSATDALFRVYGTPTVAAPTTDVYVSKKLVAVGSGELWYESSSGTMTQLTASVGQLNTADHLSACEGYGKVFIANGTKLKVVDFVNTKLTITALTTEPTRGSTVTQVTSGATMIVDFVNSAKTEIYGKTTSGTFVTTAAYTLSGGSMDPATRVPSAVDQATTTPHWYDWTVYAGNSANGVMPTTAYGVCLYRGRLVLSLNSYLPHQWYMSKIGDPFNWIYSSTNPLTAVAGNDTDAGLVGDTVKAMVPYGDDFLVFGCSGSIWVLDGDPASGGSIDKLDDTTGMYGWQSWAKDSEGNLFFFGLNGIYKMIGGRSKPGNISLVVLPTLVSDWALNPASHRVVLSYDPYNHGVIVSKTTLATGANSNYWLDLKTEGYYPESYPDACGIFSSFHYESNDPSYKSFMLGSNDSYLRKYLRTAKDDDSGDTDTAISSYMALPIEKLSEDRDKKGKLTSLTFELAGGAASGDFSDTDGVTYELHVGDDAETVLEDIRDGATAFSSATFSGTGRKNRIRPRARGHYLGIKLYNSTVSQTWSVNNVFGTILPAGN